MGEYCWNPLNVAQGCPSILRAFPRRRPFRETGPPIFMSSSLRAPALAADTCRHSVLSKVDPALFDQIERDIEAIKQKHRDDLGEKDVRYIKGLRTKSRIFEALGRGLLWISPEPITFSLGVFFTWLHRNIESIEIGHNVLHGQYDYFPEIPQFHSHNFKWKAPVDEEGWRREHNGMHHVHTNVFEMDPDLNHGILRTNEQTPWNRRHLFQVPMYLLAAYPTMTLKVGAAAACRRPRAGQRRQAAS